MFRLNQRWIPSPRALFLIALALVSLVTGVWTYVYARRRIAAVEYVRANGGVVEFSSFRDLYSAWVSVPEWPSAPEWLCRADSVGVLRGRFDLASITALDELEELWVYVEIDDASIEWAPRFQRLKSAHFSGREVWITDAGMETLGKCRRLTALTVESKSITDMGLAPLAGLPLQSLNVSGSQVTDAGLQQLAELPLEVLMLEGTQVTDRGLESISGLRLVYLSLAHTRVTDSGMQHLVGMPLNILYLAGTSVRASGVVQLKDRRLLKLTLDSRAGTVEELRQTTGIRDVHVSDR